MKYKFLVDTNTKMCLFSSLIMLHTPLSLPLVSMDTATVLVMANIAHHLDFFAAARLARLNRHWHQNIRHGTLFWGLWATFVSPSNHLSLGRRLARKRYLRKRVPLAYSVRMSHKVPSQDRTWLLHKCLTQNHLDLVDTLLRSGVQADLDTWLKAVSVPHGVACVKLLLQHRFTLSVIERDAVLTSACHLRQANVACVVLLLDSGYFSASTRAVLAFAYRHGHVGMAQLAAEHLPMDTQSRNDMLMIACKHGHADLVRWHLAQCAEPRGLSANFLEASLPYYDIVQMLLPYIELPEACVRTEQRKRTAVYCLVGQVPADAPRADEIRQAIRDHFRCKDVYQSRYAPSSVFTW